MNARIPLSTHTRTTARNTRGTDTHEFVKLCWDYGIGQKFSRCNRPQTNGKAERVIRTLMDMWHTREQFRDRKQRQISLLRFINYYNTVKPHKGIDDMTPQEKLFEHFYNKNVNNARIPNTLLIQVAGCLYMSGDAHKHAPVCIFCQFLFTLPSIGSSQIY